MATNSVKFDWSILDRQGLINFVKLISAQVVNKELTVSKIHRIFATHIKKHLPVKITKQTDTKVDFGYIYVGGSYISEEDRKRKKCIELCFVYHPGDTVFCLIVIDAFSKASDNPLCDAGKETKVVYARWSTKTNKSKFKQRTVSSCLRGITNLTTTDLFKWNPDSGPLELNYHKGGDLYIQVIFNPKDFHIGFQSTSE